ncbi:MAG: hypothetical protein ACFFCG_01520 [Promethearchaeota archaeon]
MSPSKQSIQKNYFYQIYIIISVKKALPLLTNLTNIQIKQKNEKDQNLVAIITQAENKERMNLNLKVNNLVQETKVLNIARLAKMFVDLFGLDDAFKKVGKYEGQEVELYLIELKGYITFILTSERERFDCITEKAKNPIARLVITVEEDKILDLISRIIRSKNNFLSLINFSRFIIGGKAKIKGSYIAAIKLIRCLMIGKHEVYSYDK